VPDPDNPMLALLSALIALAAQPAESARPNARAAAASEPVRVDGLLIEPSWQSAPPATGFRQREPDEGAAATEPTVDWRGVWEVAGRRTGDGWSAEFETPFARCATRERSSPRGGASTSSASSGASRKRRSGGAG
jgi:hypothetical protein